MYHCVNVIDGDSAFPAPKWEKGKGRWEWERDGMEGGWNLVCLSVCEWDLDPNLVCAHNPYYSHLFPEWCRTTGMGKSWGLREMPKMLS